MSKIFESPDGGKTVYVRESGSTERTLTESSMKVHNQVLEEIQESKLWGNIRRAAQTDPALKELLDKAILYYHLSRKNEISL